jgi:hypothetical protein
MLIIDVYSRAKSAMLEQEDDQDRQDEGELSQALACPSVPM